MEYARVGDDLPLLMARLREQHGVRSILCEGGPTLNSHLLAAGLVDELFLTLNPKLAGGAAALTIVAGRELVEPAELELVSLAEGDGDLFTRWRVAVQKPLQCVAVSRAASASTWASSMASATDTAGRSPRARGGRLRPTCRSWSSAT